eukprot:TRINITY_DN1404_c0_g1_i12.p1 TRINITY_DN1404_c0_g1~~TRINITY_DN1404_c0_g1_i12.p1  ORF type:complete len:245 (+),score=3.39 TRINITY_DN1404_c0_g1_i12:161-895(+)
MLTPAVLLMAASVGLECIMWRQTGGCVSDGPREPSLDKGCSIIIDTGLSGSCECEMGIYIGFDCFSTSSSYTCAEKCSEVERPTHTQTLTLPTLTETATGTETIPSECVDVTVQKNTATCKGSYRLIPASTAHACREYLCNLLVSEKVDTGVTAGDTLLRKPGSFCYVKRIKDLETWYSANALCEPGPEVDWSVIVPITSALAVLGVAAVAVLWWTRRPPLPAVQTGPHGATELREDHPLVSKV